MFQPPWAPSCSVHHKNCSGESALNQWKMFLRRLGRLFSSTPFPSFPFFVPGHWSAPGSPPSDTCAHSRAKRGNESFAVGDHDCRILILKMNVHIFRSLVEQKHLGQLKVFQTRFPGGQEQVQLLIHHELHQKKNPTQTTHTPTFSTIKYAHWEQGDEKIPTRSVAPGRISSVLGASRVFQIPESWQAAAIVSNWITWVRIPDLNVIWLRLLCTSQCYVDNALKIQQVL